MLSRRELLAAAAATAATSALPWSSSVKADPLGEPIGVQLYTVSAELQKDLDGTLQKLAGIGYRTVENATFANGISASRLRSALDRAGLRCPSAHYALPLLQADLSKVVDDVHALGASYVICSTPWVADMSRFEAVMKGAKTPEEGFSALMNSLTPDDWRWNADQFNKLGAELKKQGLQLGYHNHGFEFRIVDGKILFDEFLTMTEPDLVAIELDCGWVANAGYDPAIYLQRFPDRIQLLHVKDLVHVATDRTSMKMDSIHVGGGILNWPGIFAAAKRAGVKGYFVELEHPLPAPVFDELKSSYDYLHQLS